METVKYNEFLTKIKEILDLNKNDLGIKRVFLNMPPIISSEHTPAIAVCWSEIGAEDEPVTTDGQFRFSVSAEIWIIVCQIDNDVMLRAKEDVEYSGRLQETINGIIGKVKCLMTKNRSIQSIATDTVVSSPDWLWRPSAYQPNSWIAGARIRIRGTLKAMGVELI